TSFIQKPSLLTLPVVLVNTHFPAAILSYEIMIRTLVYDKKASYSKSSSAKASAIQTLDTAGQMSSRKKVCSNFFLRYSAILGWK
ncbi:MAG: hypothetical protein M0R50_05275, partial [Candidatus Cloacimonetes bacterium]|nr:hypothetical protein [Candidatus Cloacimonadota bacterium]